MISSVQILGMSFRRPEQDTEEFEELRGLDPRFAVGKIGSVFFEEDPLELLERFVGNHEGAVIVRAMAGGGRRGFVGRLKSHHT